MKKNTEQLILEEEINQFIKNFGAIVKKIRIENKHKQESFAHSVHMSTKQISDIENGKACCRIDTLYKICSSLNITIEDLFKLMK